MNNVPADEKIAPIGASCRAARKAGGQMNKAMPMRFVKNNKISTITISWGLNLAYLC
jgi:hypothetical protein